MSREVEYGIKVVAEDQLTAPVAKATEAVKRFDAATENTQRGLKRGMAAAQAFGAAISSHASKGVAGLTSALNKLGPALSGARAGLGAMKGALSGAVLVAGVAAAGIVTYARALTEYAAAASRVEHLETRTLAAIRERVDLSDQEFEAIKRLNAERERTLGIDADEQMRLQGTLVSMGVRIDQLDEATRATIGLSTATGQGLNEASRVVAKALSGNTAALQEYGIKVSSVSEAQVKFAQMFAVAAAQADSYGSRVLALGHSWDGLFEAIGGVITQSPDVKRAIASVTDTLVTLTQQLGPGSIFAEQFGQALAVVADHVRELIQEAASPQGREAIQQFFLSSLSVAKSLADLLPTIASGLSAITERAANTARVIEESGFLGLTFMSKADVEEQGRELRRMDRQRAAEAAAELERIMRPGRESMMGALLPGAGDGMGGLEDRAGKIRPFALLEKIGAGKDAGAGAAKKALAEQESALDSAMTRMQDAAKRHAEFLARVDRDAAEKRRAFAEADTAYQIELTNKQEEAKLDIMRSRMAAQQAAEEAARERTRRDFEDLVSFFQGIGQSLVSIFGDAFSQVGRLQTKTTTEIVRNERGMLEERTRITDQYVADIGDALGKFLGDSATMFAKAAMHLIAVKSVEAAVSAMSAAIGTLGLVGLVVAGGVASVAAALVTANKAKVPPPPKFFTGGVVPGPMGQSRLAVVEGGERVTSVADRIDGRGAGGATVVINNNVLAAPSRVQMERVNRDAVMPSMRRLQRLGFAS